MIFLLPTRKYENLFYNQCHVGFALCPSECMKEIAFPRAFSVHKILYYITNYKYNFTSMSILMMIFYRLV